MLAVNNDDSEIIDDPGTITNKFNNFFFVNVGPETENSVPRVPNTKVCSKSFNYLLIFFPATHSTL